MHRPKTRSDTGSARARNNSGKSLQISFFPNTFFRVQALELGSAERLGGLKN